MSRPRPCTGCSPRSSGSSRPCSTCPSPATTRRCRCRSGPRWPSLLAEPDAEKLLAGFARITVAINARTSDAYRILAGASGSDPAAAALLADYQQQRDDGQGRIARSLARAGALRPGLRARDAADLIHALMSPELYRLLVVDRGWTLRRYEEWLASILADQLTSPLPRSPRSAQH